jgi:hypothetical protein
MTRPSPAFAHIRANSPGEPDGAVQVEIREVYDYTPEGELVGSGYGLVR